MEALRLRKVKELVCGSTLIKPHLNVDQVTLSQSPWHLLGHKDTTEPHSMKICYKCIYVEVVYTRKNFQSENMSFHLESTPFLNCWNRSFGEHSQTFKQLQDHHKFCFWQDIPSILHLYLEFAHLISILLSRKEWK